MRVVARHSHESSASRVTRRPLRFEWAIKDARGPAPVGKWQELLATLGRAPTDSSHVIKCEAYEN
jgi:hypothetical protein